jgi:enamine deaminase RidA (YjgF/YER057c/UK114 family)
MATIGKKTRIIASCYLGWGTRPREICGCACYIQMQMTLPLSPEQTLASLGYELPPAPAPGGNYVSAKRVGSIVYLSGVISTGANGIITGTAGLDRSIEEGYAAARACALTQLAVLKRELGSLDQVAEVLTVNGYVNAANGFGDSPAVINGASDLLVDVFGEAGRHVRAAVGLNALPRNALVEVQMTVRVRES